MKKITVLLLLLSLTVLCSAQVEKKRISLDDINVYGTFSARSVYGINSMNDGEHYTVMERGGRVVKYSYSTGEQVEVLFDVSSFNIPELVGFSSYELSADEEKLLIATEVNPIYRHSFVASFYILDLATKAIVPLSEGGQQMLATFSPDGNRVAFVRDNNIFIKNLITKKEQQITFDGLFNHIINGAVDWVYEEEFHLTTGMHWSPDSKRIAFYRFDESHVNMFHMPMYMNELYPPNYSFKYPKAGEENSLVSIHVYDLETEDIITMDVGPETDQYIARIKWTSKPNEISMVRLNRLQNKVDILIADAKTGRSKILYTETNRYYIEEPTNDYPIFSDDGKHFILTSERDGFNHFYLYGMDGKLIRQLTKGEKDVRSIYGYDSKSKRLYYNAYDGSPLRTAVFYVSIDGKKQGKVSTLNGTNSADFSKGFKYYIHFHSSTDTPTLVALHDIKGKQIRVLEDNARLKEVISYYEIGRASWRERV